MRNPGKRHCCYSSRLSSAYQRLDIRWQRHSCASKRLYCHTACCRSVSKYICRKPSRHIPCWCYNLPSNAMYRYSDTPRRWYMQTHIRHLLYIQNHAMHSCRMPSTPYLYLYCDLPPDTAYPHYCIQPRSYNYNNRYPMFCMYCRSTHSCHTPWRYLHGWCCSSSSNTAYPYWHIRQMSHSHIVFKFNFVSVFYCPKNFF